MNIMQQLVGRYANRRGVSFTDFTNTFPSSPLGLEWFLIWHEIAEIDVFPKVQQGVKWFCKWFQIDFLDIFQQYPSPTENTWLVHWKHVNCFTEKFIVIKCKSSISFTFQKKELKFFWSTSWKPIYNSEVTKYSERFNCNRFLLVKINCQFQIIVWFWLKIQRACRNRG